jgi:hemoglobin
MRHYRQFLVVLILLTCSGGCATTTQAEEKATGSLYQRLGGYDAIAAVCDDFITRFSADPQGVRFFAGFSVNSRKKIRQLIVDQICEASGGPCYYTGRDMKTTHAGLGITENDWQVFVKHFVASLDKYKVPPKEKNEVLAVLTPLKKDIVEK